MGLFTNKQIFDYLGEFADITLGRLNSTGSPIFIYIKWLYVDGYSTTLLLKNEMDMYINANDYYWES